MRKPAPKLSILSPPKVIVIEENSSHQPDSGFKIDPQPIDDPFFRCQPPLEEETKQQHEELQETAFRADN